MLPHENINEMYSRMNNIVNELNGLSCDLTDLDIVRKMLRALPEKYETLVTLFLNSSELPKMTPTALLGNLITNEMYKKDKDELKEMASTSSKRIHAFKAECDSSEDEDQNEEDDDTEEDMVTLMKKMKDLMKRRDSHKHSSTSSNTKHHKTLRCYNCQKLGHIASKCPYDGEDEEEPKSSSRKKNDDKRGHFVGLAIK